MLLFRFEQGVSSYSTQLAQLHLITILLLFGHGHTIWQPRKN